MTNIKVSTTIDDFNQAIDFWLMHLDYYTPEQLTAKPSAGDWSVGQMYLHLIADTDFHLCQLAHCFVSENRNDVPVAMAQAMFTNNSFPDLRLTGDPSNATIPQPRSASELRAALQCIRAAANNLADLMRAHLPEGKSRHPGFGYLTAGQWIQFTAMHLRHHMRQKQRLDTWLKTKYSTYHANGQ